MGILNKIIEYVNGAQLEGASYKPTTPYTGGLPAGKVKRGNRSTDVKHVQKFLNWCIKAGLKVDGYCGSKTVAAIKKYQKQYKLKVDGVFGSQSKKKAKSIIAKYAPAPAPAPTPAPVPQPTTNADKILATAASLIGSSKTPTAAYKAALNKAFPNRSKWGKAAKAGRSCDVFVGTVIRSLGIDKNYPRGLAEQFLYKPSGFTRTVYKNVTPYSVSKDGDVIIYSKNKVPTKSNRKSCKGHTCIRGNGVIYEANYPSKYPHVNKDVKKKLNVKRPYVVILRAK